MTTLALADCSFDSSPVTFWEVADATLTLKISGMRYQGAQQLQATLVFQQLRNLQVQRFDEDRQAWCDVQAAEGLGYLSQIHCKMSERYALQGIAAQSGDWLSVSFVSPDLTVVLDESESPVSKPVNN